MTILFAKRHKKYLHIHVSYEGSLELNPDFQNDIDELRLVSPQFIKRLFILLIFLCLLWWLSIVTFDLPQFFSVIVGAFLLQEAVVHLRHIRNLSMYPIAKSGGLKGKIEYTRWSMLNLSAVELFSFGVLFLLLAALLKSWFFVGGGFGSLFTGIRHWKMAT
ncbi:MAG: hypothetical protein ACFFCP_18330, partial [Promethearchaeota archaeon]